MPSVATPIAFAGACVLLWAALEKARDLAPTVATLRRLGVPVRAARPGVLLLVPVEAAVALAIVLRPDSAWTHGGVVALAASFAAAALVALRRGVHIRCGCFGSRGGRLGARQMVAFVLWATGAAVLNASDVAASPPSRAAAMLAGVALTIAILRLATVVGAFVQARGDRRSARATYLWLQR